MFRLIYCCKRGFSTEQDCVLFFEMSRFEKFSSCRSTLLLSGSITNKEIDSLSHYSNMNVNIYNTNLFITNNSIKKILFITTCCPIELDQLQGLTEFGEVFYVANSKRDESSLFESIKYTNYKNFYSYKEG